MFYADAGRSIGKVKITNKMKKCLRKFALLAAALALPGISASAYDLEVGGIFYNIVSFDDMTCEVTSDDEGTTQYEGDVVIPETITYNGRTLTVAKIGDGAFEYAPITSITIPCTVTSQVGSDAFRKCTKLKKVVIEDGDTPLHFAASHYVDELWHQERAMPMFGDSPLETVYLGRAVYLPWGGSDYNSSETTPFCGNETLREVVIGNSVDELRDFTFKDCENLQTVTFGTSIVKIGKECFYRCKKLVNATMPNSVEIIDDDAFNGCSNLTSVTLGNSVATIGNNAFSYCGFHEMVIPNSVKYIGKSAFTGCPLEFLSMGNSVETIDDGVFYGCHELVSITIPGSVKVFGNQMFQNCKRLVSVTIGNAVPSLGMSTFDGCESLKEIVIGSSVSQIGRNAFRGCAALSLIYVNNPVPPTGADFENQAYMNAALHVPQGSLADYQAAIGWKDFWSIREFVPNGIEGAAAEEVLRPVIKAAGGLVTVTDAAGTVAVYDMGGALLKEVKAVGGSAVIPLPVGRVYVVKVGDVAEKVVM